MPPSLDPPPLFYSNRTNRSIESNASDGRGGAAGRDTTQTVLDFAGPRALLLLLLLLYIQLLLFGFAGFVASSAFLLEGRVSHQRLVGLQAGGSGPPLIAPAFGPYGKNVTTGPSKAWWVVVAKSLAGSWPKVGEGRLSLLGLTLV
jgi:hypothetical protein